MSLESFSSRRDNISSNLEATSEAPKHAIPRPPELSEGLT